MRYFSEEYKMYSLQPYWKVNNDGAIENKLTLPVYKWYYNTFKKGKTLSFKTSTMFDLELLNRDYYRGRFANKVRNKTIYNWEE